VTAVTNSSRLDDVTREAGDIEKSESESGITGNSSDVSIGSALAKPGIPSPAGTGISAPSSGVLAIMSMLTAAIIAIIRTIITHFLMLDMLINNPRFGDRLL